jgi:hypothetical protein
MRSEGFRAIREARFPDVASRGARIEAPFGVCWRLAARRTEPGKLLDCRIVSRSSQPGVLLRQPVSARAKEHALEFSCIGANWPITELVPC